MRVYLPLISTELSLDVLPRRRCWTARPPLGLNGEERELLEDDAQTEAALDSLILLRENQGNALRRIVVALDVDDSWAANLSSEGVIAIPDVDCTHGKIAAILIDGEESEPAVRAVIEAEEQEQADEAIAALWDESLEWYDAEERLVLAGKLHG
ncbi:MULTISPECIES: DUF6912 family protein [unclassified Schaalia]|uniref:DUF6912 family protein n=1 Tax=unclassified Schaalia TaxID=2691889 RepID=UPI001E2B9C06|nr:MULTISPECIES: hypothetical protein [unclassified Schaalia]MCD4549268.1 hypothetical protein [Schaalia sp. lx-260]MCD4557077.1 hypothetical protein [Schaalia sp. lx-100]